MKHAPRLHPCLPVPYAEQRRLAAVAHMAVVELRAGQAEQALVDLQAAAAICAALMAGDRFTDDARQAVESADVALAGVAAGTYPYGAAAAVCASMIEVFTDLLSVTTLRRLEDAKAAVRRAAAASCP